MNDTELHCLVKDQVSSQVRNQVCNQVCNQVWDQALTFYLQGLTKL